MFAGRLLGAGHGPAYLRDDRALARPGWFTAAEFVRGEPVCAGDTITTEATVREIHEKDGKTFYVFESVSKNQDGQETVRATWTNIVR